VLKPTLCAAFKALQRPHLAKKLHTDAIVGYPLLLFFVRDHTADLRLMQKCKIIVWKPS
jgi:hypothetical protein